MSIHTNWPRPRMILDYYSNSRRALEIVANPEIVTESIALRFFSRTLEELRVMVVDLFQELEQQSVMMLTASIEATFQVDLRVRSSRKLKDHCSTSLRRMERTKLKARQRVEVEDILDSWKKSLGYSDRFGDLKQVVMYRHWLAHGRYWNQKSGLGVLDPLEVWQRWDAVLSVMKDFPLE